MKNGSKKTFIFPLFFDILSTMKKEILDLINLSNNILIVTHINPDGDTLGSASAFKSFLVENLSKKTDILIQIKDNFNFPNTYSFLPYINESLNFETLKDDYDLIIALDIASKDRMVDKMGVLFNKTPNTIAIDHHKTNKGYAKLNHIRGGISSTGEVLYDFFVDLGQEITKNMAIGIYTAILTDTGCFKYESTTSHTFEIAAKLSNLGINTSEIADLCYTNKPKNMILFQNFVVSNAVFCLNDKIAYALITKDLMDKYKIKDEYTEGICETLRSIYKVEAAFVLKETQNGTKVSIRTKDKDATLIAQAFSGGGHKRASGCTIKMQINQAFEALLKETKKIL